MPPRRRTRLFIALAVFASFWLFSGRSSSSSSSSSASSSSAYSSSWTTTNQIIRRKSVLEHLNPFSSSDNSALDTQKHTFLQSRMGREEDEPWAKDDVMGMAVRNGVEDYWERFQKPNILNSETTHMDTQTVRAAIDDLLALNGWVAAACPTLTRPFQSSSASSSSSSSSSSTSQQLKQFTFLSSPNPPKIFIAIVIHSADHFLVDQLATIVQLSKRLGPQHLFVSMLDYYSTDATPTLLDLSEAVLTLLSIPFRIRRVSGLTASDSASYYPLEEAYTRNLVLEPLHELYTKRQITFSRVLWLKGFTCPLDIFESLKISYDNSAAMVCGMDWAEHAGFFIFSDRWRTRDMLGDQFRQSKSSTSSPPPRDPKSAERYVNHLPFQVFCCESGTHIVDPAQAYYKGIKYRSSVNFHNLTSDIGGGNVQDGEEECMDSSQAYFCRDLWVMSAKDGLKGMPMMVQPLTKQQQQQHKKKSPSSSSPLSNKKHKKRKEPPPVEAPLAPHPLPPPNPNPNPNPAPGEIKPLLAGIVDKPVAGEAKIVPPPAAVEVVDKPAVLGGKEEIVNVLLPKKKGGGDEEGGGDSDSDANRGSDFDAMPGDVDEEEGDGGVGGERQPPPQLISNALFSPARILVNPRCVTTYAGVSHTQLALDLFGSEEEEKKQKQKGVNKKVNTTTNVGVGGEKKYVLDDWEGAPDSFVCQEQRTTGGRKATKTQRRLGFSIHDELERMGMFS